MPDDDPFHRAEDAEPDWTAGETPDPDRDAPASVVFMEIMRKAAKEQSPPPRDPLTRAPSTLPAATGSNATAESPDAQSQAESVQAQRIQRVKRRRARQRRRTVGVLGGIIRSVLVVTIAAGLTATIFTWWTDSQFLSDEVRAELSIAMATSTAVLSSAEEPTGLPTPNWLRRVGVVSGHRGPENDPGAVCPDGLTEASITFSVSQAVVRNLRSRGYSVDLLDEFDPRLNNYQAAALVSIHANTCQEWPGEIVSGFLISAAASRPSGNENDRRLVECVAQHYAQASGLNRREGLTLDMTDYHTFREIHSETPAAIIELGFMLADQQVLTGQTEALAQGITDGALCFLEPELAGATATP